jgi:hypothetical protein
MKTKNTIPMQEPSKDANSGAGTVAGKTNDCDSAITDVKVLQTEPEKIREAVEVPGKALECIQQQVGQNGNGKHRDSSETGVGAKSIADANSLKSDR